MAAILVDERADGMHLSYDSMASLTAPCGSESALVVAGELDARNRVSARDGRAVTGVLAELKRQQGGSV
jgi:hypothetical protein